MWKFYISSTEITGSIYYHVVSSVRELKKLYVFNILNYPIAIFLLSMKK